MLTPDSRKQFKEHVTLIPERRGEWFGHLVGYGCFLSFGGLVTSCWSWSGRKQRKGSIQGSLPLFLLSLFLSLLPSVRDESSGYMPRSGIAGSSGSVMPSFLRNLQTDFHSGCTILQPHQQWRSVPLSACLWGFLTCMWTHQPNVMHSLIFTLCVLFLYL